MAIPKLPYKVSLLLPELVGLPPVHFTDRPFCYYFLLFYILIAVVGIKLSVSLTSPSNPRLPAWIGIVVTVLMLAIAVCFGSDS
jgi:uncharacterized membrane protein YkvI